MVSAPTIEDAPLEHARLRFSFARAEVRIETFLEAERGQLPLWFVALFAGGIAMWLWLPGPRQWAAFIVLALGLSFVRSLMSEASAFDGDPLALEEQSFARCSRDACVADIFRDGRAWRLLAIRSRDRIEWETLTAACRGADIVVASRRLPRGSRRAGSSSTALSYRRAAASRFTSATSRTLQASAIASASIRGVSRRRRCSTPRARFHPGR